MDATAAGTILGGERNGKDEETDTVLVKRRTLQALLEDCQRALEQLSRAGEDCSGDYEDDSCRLDDDPGRLQEDQAGERTSLEGDSEADKLYDLIKSRVGCQDFLDKIECAQVSLPLHSAEDGSSWDMVNNNDLWDGDGISADDDYVLVRQEDIVDGIACFMATYLLTLNETKEVTPNQLQRALSKTFSVKKRKGKLRKAWEGSKIIYNVASWGATVIGIYQNPVIFKVATKAFWASCRIISKFV